MATQTPNLKLNIFEGSERPDKNLFNENNQKIDAILKTASTHTHDGVNAAKISAKNVVFNNGETTLKAINLEDAVKEVFTEADNKITWITNAIGTTLVGNLSDPDKRFDEINTDFIASRTKYRDDMSKVTGFIVATGLPDASASIEEISTAIDNTVIDGVTATKHDIISGITSVTKYGVVEEGSLGLMTQDKLVYPSKDEEIIIDRGLYNNIELAGFGQQFPERLIRKGKNILGIDGILEERGSNGWDIGESIEKRKTDVLNLREAYMKPLLTNGDATFSLPYEVLISNIDTQHYLASSYTNTQVDVKCFSHDFRRSVVIGIPTLSFMSFKKNMYTNRPLFYVGRYDDTNIKYQYAVCVGNTTTSANENVVGSEVVIYNLTDKSRMYRRTFTDINIIDIIYPEPSKSAFNNSIVLIGRKPNNNYVYITIAIKADGKGYAHFKEQPNTDLFVGTRGKDIYLLPNYTVTTSTYDKDEECNCMINSATKESILYENDALVFNNMHTTSSLTLKLKSVNATDQYKILDINGLTITSGSITGAKDVILNISNRTYFSIVCSKGKLFVQDVLDNGQSIFKPYIYELEPLKQISFNELDNKPIVLWGQTIYDGNINKCDSVLIVDNTLELFDGSSANNCIHVSKVELNNFNLVNNYRTMLNGCVSTNWGYGQDNMLFSNYLDALDYRASAAGAKWYRHHRDLIKLSYKGLSIGYTLEVTKMQTGISYKPFRPCFIDSSNRVMGIERSCTPDKFEYFCVLSSTLQGLYSYEGWSETYMRNLNDDLVILDELNTINGQGFITAMLYCYDRSGNKSKDKLVGCLKQRNVSNKVDTSDFIQNVNNSLVNEICGVSALFTEVYRINSTRV